MNMPTTARRPPYGAKAMALNAIRRPTPTPPQPTSQNYEAVGALVCAVRCVWWRSGATCFYFAPGQRGRSTTIKLSSASAGWNP
eukprot:scaffold1883_cov396-Prasinococcus_capsulatus_cf.AAC.36